MNKENTLHKPVATDVYNMLVAGGLITSHRYHEALKKEKRSVGIFILFLNYENTKKRKRKRH